ncbi:MAG: hypothetical protein HGA94_04800 [Candidatus Aminicenantes bacterium]|nr:hypothetical protein [Candidatus Aminicenantes bacterium]
MAVNTGLMLLLYKPMGVGGITLSTSVVSLINFFGLMIILRPRIGGIDARRVAWSAGRSKTTHYQRFGTTRQVSSSRPCGRRSESSAWV